MIGTPDGTSELPGGLVESGSMGTSCRNVDSGMVATAGTIEEAGAGGSVGTTGIVGIPPAGTTGGAPGRALGGVTGDVARFQMAPSSPLALSLSFVSGGLIGSARS